MADLDDERFFTVSEQDLRSRAKETGQHLTTFLALLDRFAQEPSAELLAELEAESDAFRSVSRRLAERFQWHLDKLRYRLRTQSLPDQRGPSR